MVLGPLGQATFRLFKLLQFFLKSFIYVFETWSNRDGQGQRKFLSNGPHPKYLEKLQVSHVGSRDPGT